MTDLLVSKHEICTCFAQQRDCEAFRAAHPSYTKPEEVCQEVRVRLGPWSSRSSITPTLRCCPRRSGPTCTPRPASTDRSMAVITHERGALKKDENPMSDFDGYPADWPRCMFCDLPRLDGHLTCG